MSPARLVLPVLLQAALLAGGARAQPPAPAGAPASAQARMAPSQGERQALEWFHMLDSDGDGRISRAEARVGFVIKPSLRQLFEDADTDGDGYLTQEEIRAAADRRRAERQRRREAEARSAAEAQAQAGARPAEAAPAR